MIGRKLSKQFLARGSRELRERPSRPLFRFIVKGLAREAQAPTHSLPVVARGAKLMGPQHHERAEELTECHMAAGMAPESPRQRDGGTAADGG